MNIPEQIKWERECVERGTARYYATQDRMRDSGQADQSDTVSYLLRDRLEEVAEKLDVLSTQNIGKGGKYNKLLRSAVLDKDFLKVAYIGTKSAFQVILMPKENTVLKVCLEIASRLEADLKCQMFEAEHPAYYAVVMASFKDQKVVDYVHKHKVLMKKFNDFDLEWTNWTPLQKTQIGSRVLRCILEVFWDVLFIRKDWAKGKSTARLDTTVLFDDWAAEFEKERGFMYPFMLPLKVEPKAWEEGNELGAYYTTQMCVRYPFIKTKGKDHKEFVKSNNPEQHRQAVNRLQCTAWEINKEVLEVQEAIYVNGLGIGMPSNQQILPPEFPKHLKDVVKEKLTDRQKEEIGDWKALAKRAYGREQQRKGKILAFMQSYKLANELSTWSEFYFAYNCDFRGRIYCATSGLSPQGADTAKGLLQFKRTVRLGAAGIKWLAIHGANTFGEDKVSFEERITWVNSMRSNIQRVVDNPIGSREWWGMADKPYQFLAFCFEWSKCNYGQNENYEGNIPIGMDGSCNGLQHYSAMLRDAVGAESTNLRANIPKPNDIYGDVANVVIRMLREYKDDPRATKWLSIGIDRKCAKRPVMTLPYGATQQSARQYILEYVQDVWEKFELDEKHQWEFAKFLTPILWEAIGEVVIAARAAMVWLQKNISKGYTHWVTPIGFPVFQYYKKADAIDVNTKLNGRLVLKLRDADGEGEPNRYGQRNGIAPNFVHSIDSSHMVMTINKIELPAYAMIHDDFGTHAGNAEKLATALREAFKDLYTLHDPLADWAEQQGIDVSTLPEVGEYDINEILNAEYFFA